MVKKASFNALQSQNILVSSRVVNNTGKKYCNIQYSMQYSIQKSDAVLFGTQQRLRAFPHITSINIAGSVVHLSDTVTTL